MNEPKIGNLYKCTFDTKAYHADSADKDSIMDLKDKLVILMNYDFTSHRVRVYSIEDQMEYNKILFIEELQEV